MRRRQGARTAGRDAGSLVQSGTSCQQRRCGSSPGAGPARVDPDASENNHDVFVFASLSIEIKLNKNAFSTPKISKEILLSPYLSCFVYHIDNSLESEH